MLPIERFRAHLWRRSWTESHGRPSGWVRIEGRRTVMVRRNVRIRKDLTLHLLISSPSPPKYSFRFRPQTASSEESAERSMAAFSLCVGNLPWNGSSPETSDGVSSRTLVWRRWNQESRNSSIISSSQQQRRKRSNSRSGLQESKDFFRSCGPPFVIRRSCNPLNSLSMSEDVERYGVLYFSPERHHFVYHLMTLGRRI